MRLIKIINSIYGHRPAGSKYIQPKRAGDPPFEVEDDKAESLVAKGVAVYVDAEPVATPSNKEDDPETGDDIPEDDNSTGGEENADADKAESQDGKEDPNDSEVEDDKADGSDTEDPDSIEKPEYSMDTKFDDLRELLKKCELPYKVGMTKADIVAALDEFFDGEEPPELDAEDPVL